MKNRKVIVALFILLLSFPIFLAHVNSQTEESIFSIRIIDFQSPVILGEFMEFSYSAEGIFGVGDTATTSFWIEKDKEMITSGSDTIFLGQGGSERISNIFIPSSFESGIYELNMEVNYNGHIEEAHRTIELSVETNSTKVIPDLRESIKKTRLLVLSLLVLLAILNIYLIYDIEKKKIKIALIEEKQFIKKHKTSILTISFFIILGVLVYSLKGTGFLPNIPLYYYYSILGVLTLGVLFLARSKKH